MSYMPTVQFWGLIPFHSSLFIQEGNTLLVILLHLSGSLVLVTFQIQITLVLTVLLDIKS